MEEITSIPTVLRIDIEPDDHQPGSKSSWNGFVEMTRIVDHLRSELEKINPFRINPLWMVRLDPDIKRCFGRTDFVVKKYPHLFEDLLQKQDSLGIHVHAHKWNEKKNVVYSDYADEDWVGECLTVSADTFRECFGEHVRRSSQGGFFLTEKLLELLISIGIKVDLTVEPGLHSRINDASFGAYATAPSPDFSDFPQRPYYPSKKNYKKPATNIKKGSSILLLPLTSYPYHHSLKTPARRIASRLLGRPRPHYPLNMWKKWPSPKIFWDIAMKAADRQGSGYLAFAIRTDGTESVTHRRARDLLSYLPNHPIAKRMNIVDPLSDDFRNLVIPKFKN